MASFEDLRKLTAKLDDSVSTQDALAALAQAVPDSFFLQDLEQEIVAARSGQNPRATVLALLACLKKDAALEDAQNSTASSEKLAGIIATAMAPINESDDDINDIQATYARVAERSRNTAGAGLEALQLLLERAPTTLDDQTLLTLAAFADTSAAWTTPAASKVAVDLLRQQVPENKRERFVVDTILKDYLRPLFSKSRPATVTASGRKAEYVDRERETGLPDDSRKTKPWKHEDLRAVSVFSWAVEEADEQLITQHWPVFIPVLLTLADDSTTRVRARGLEILGAFLQKLPSKKLQETGLASVFEQAIFPTLLYLPSLTPVNESLLLLDPAYDVLLILARHISTDKDKAKFLDKILREGVFTAYFHAKDYVKIVELLFRQTASIVVMMGIDSVKHLKDLIPMACTVMSDPFATASPSTLLSAIQTLQAIISNAWPRISGGPWRDEILKALVLAWLNNHESAKTDDRVGSELIKTANLLSAVMKTTQSSLKSHAAPLVSKEPTLAPLFVGSS